MDGRPNSHSHCGSLVFSVIIAFGWPSKFAFSLRFPSVFCDSSVWPAVQIRILTAVSTQLGRRDFRSVRLVCASAVPKIMTWMSNDSNASLAFQSRMSFFKIQVNVRQTPFRQTCAAAKNANPTLSGTVFTTDARTQVVPYTSNLCSLPNSRSPSAWGSYS